MTFNPSRLSFLGIAKEVTPGTGVAATNYIPVKMLSPQDKIDYLDVDVFTGSMVKTFNVIQGVEWAEYEFEGPVFADAIGWSLGGVLGNVTTTGTAAPYTHTMSTLNTAPGQPTSFSLTDFYGVTQARQFTGIQVSEVNLKFSAEGLFEHTTKCVGLKPSAGVTKPTASYSAVTAYPAWLGLCKINGTTVSLAMDGEINIVRQNEIEKVIGQQNPAAVFVGELSVTGKLHLLMPDDTYYTMFTANTQPSLELNWQQGAGAAATQVDLKMNQAAFTNAKINRGKKVVAVDVDLTAVANTTNAGSSGGMSPIQAVLQNALPSGTFQSQ